MTWNKVSFQFQKMRLIKWGPLFQKINQNPCDIEGFRRILVIMYLSLGGILPFVN
jgi:hypothetical protein